MIVFISVLLYSCDDIYLSFPEGVQELFCYRAGDCFSLLENETNDTLVFEVTNYRNEYEKDRYNFLSPYNDQYRQILLIEFGSVKNVYGGMMFSEDVYSPSITISLVYNQSIFFEEKLVDTLLNYTLNSKEYPELFVFACEKGQSPMLYFSKDEGIVYIDSTASGNSYALIEYIMGE
ncbi:MAG: hypothetical protein K9H26_16640 [Prolixibacteraceae bacterium]|nr:hypothetical protein [Prolixibacteraceae bacterium]